MRVGKALVQYEVVRTQMKLVASPDEVRLGDAGGIEVDEPERFPEDVVRAFERVAPRHGAIAVRDKAQLDWRYVDHPERSYAFAVARRGGEPCGYAVWRKDSFDGSEDGLVCDWLVDPDDARAVHALLRWVVERAREEGAERVTAVFPETVPEWISFQRAGFRAAPTQYPFVARTCVRRYDPWWLRGRWYYTLGDTDLV